MQLVHQIGELLLKLTGHGVVLCLAGLVLNEAEEDCEETGVREAENSGCLG